MKIAVVHDYADVFRTTRAYQRLKGHDVVVHTDAYTEPARVVEQVAGCEAVLLTQQRVPVTREIVARLPDLRFINQTSANVYHVDLAACTEHGVVLSARGFAPRTDRRPGAGDGGGRGAAALVECAMPLPERADFEDRPLDGTSLRGHPAGCAYP